MRASTRRVLALLGVTALTLSPLAGLPALAVHEAGHALGAWLSGGQVTSVHLGLDLAGHTETRGGALLAVLLGGPLAAVVLPAGLAAVAGGVGGRLARAAEAVGLVVLLRAVLDLGWHGLIAPGPYSDAARVGAAVGAPARLVGASLFAVGLAMLLWLAARARYRMFQVSSMGPKPAA